MSNIEIQAIFWLALADISGPFLHDRGTIQADQLALAMSWPQQLIVMTKWKIYHIVYVRSEQHNNRRPGAVLSNARTTIKTRVNG